MQNIKRDIYLHVRMRSLLFVPDNIFYSWFDIAIAHFTAVTGGNLVGKCHFRKHYSNGNSFWFPDLLPIPVMTTSKYNHCCAILHDFSKISTVIELFFLSIHQTKSVQFHQALKHSWHESKMLSLTHCESSEKC